jgi:hypothetical protein
MKDGWWRDIDEYRMDAIRVTLAVFIIAIVVRYIESSVTSNDIVVCKLLIQNAERFFSMASQDSSALIRLRHSAMAVANLQTARQLFNDSVIENATGLDVHTTSQRMESFLNKNEVLDRPMSTIGKKTNNKPLPIWP